VETRHKKSVITKENWKDENVREKRITQLRKSAKIPEKRQKRSESMKDRLNKQPSLKRAMIKRLREYGKSEEGKQVFSKLAKERWESGVFNEIHIRKMHEGLKMSWQVNRQQRLDILAKNYEPQKVRERALQVTGEKASYWKGEKATYNSKHRWIQKHWNKTGVCEMCKKKTVPFGKRHFGTEWANISGHYDRLDRTDWKELCPTCHRRFDHNL